MVRIETGRLGMIRLGMARPEMGGLGLGVAGGSIVGTVRHGMGEL